MPKRGVIESRDESDEDATTHALKKNWLSNNGRKRRNRMITSDDEESSELSEAPSISPSKYVREVMEGLHSAVDGTRDPQKAVSSRLVRFDILNSPPRRDVGGDTFMEKATTTASNLEHNGSSGEPNDGLYDEDSTIVADENQTSAAPGSIYTRWETPVDRMYNTPSKISMFPRKTPRAPISLKPTPPPAIRDHNSPTERQRSATPLLSLPFALLSSPQLQTTPEPHRTIAVTNAPRSPQKRSQKYASEILSWSDARKITPLPVRPPASKAPKTTTSPRIKAAPSPKTSSNPPEKDLAPAESSKSSLIVRLKRPAQAVKHSVSATQSTSEAPYSATNYLNPETMDVDDEEEPMARSAGMRDLSPLSDPSEITPPKRQHSPHQSSHQDIQRRPPLLQTITGTTPTSPSPSSSLSPPRSLVFPTQTNSDYESLLDEAVRRQWPPFAKMREELANARLDDDRAAVSDSEEESQLVKLLEKGVAVERLPFIVEGNTTPVDRGAEEVAHGYTISNHTGEANLSVALAMRRFVVDRFRNAATSVRGMLAGATGGDIVAVAPPHVIVSTRLEEGGKETVALDGSPHRPDEIEDDGSSSLTSLTPTSHGAYGNRAESLELPSPPLFLRKLPALSPTTPALSRNDSTTPVTVNTPATDSSTAAALISDFARKPPSIPIYPLPIQPGSASPFSVKTKAAIATPYAAQDSDAPESAPYDFSYDSPHMRIKRQDSDHIRLVTRGSSTTGVSPPSKRHSGPGERTPGRTVYAPKRQFLGVEIRRPKRRTGGSFREPIAISDDDDSFVESVREPDDLSESELTPAALDLYLAIRYYQEHVEPTLDGRKRKGEVLDSSTSDGSSRDDEYRITTKAEPKRSYKKRKLVDAASKVTSTASSTRRSSTISPVAKAYAPAMRLASGTAYQLEVPFGIGVDDLDPTTLHVRSVREGLVSTNKICHQCRNSGTTESGRIQCGNVTNPTSNSATADSTPADLDATPLGRPVRCNKTFCERCLRGWYALDDNALKFLRGREEAATMTGTGLGLGIVEGKWICPVCIDMCMCTVCTKRTKVPRTRYRPSGLAVVSNVGPERKPKGRMIRTNIAPRIHEPAHASPEKTIKSSGNGEHTTTQSSSRVVNLHPVPAQWLPSIPTPTPGLDPMYYEPTRPCTRDFPTGAPPPTAATYAPILYQSGANLENDGLEDSFTGSEMDEGEHRAVEKDAEEYKSLAEPPRADWQGDARQKVDAPVNKRRNYLIVTPGRRLPTATKKISHAPAARVVSPPASTPFFHVADPPYEEEITGAPEASPEATNAGNLPVLDEEPDESPISEAIYLQRHYHALQDSPTRVADMHLEEPLFSEQLQQPQVHIHEQHGMFDYMVEPTLIDNSANSDILMYPCDFLSPTEPSHLSLNTSPSPQTAAALPNDPLNADPYTHLPILFSPTEFGDGNLTLSADILTLDPPTFDLTTSLN